MQVERAGERHAPQTIALLEDLRVSALGVRSPRLYRALISDAVRGRIDCRVAVDRDQVVGAVLAAPASYWRTALWTHWTLAIECVLAPLARGRGSGGEPAPGRAADGAAGGGDGEAGLDPGTPPRSWASPGDAWRIIFVGTAPAARARGVATRLYQSLMSDRSLVARIGSENRASLRLHRSLGWRLYPDGRVILAVHLHDPGYCAVEARPGRMPCRRPTSR